MRALLVTVVMLVFLTVVGSAMAKSYPHVGGYKSMTSFQVNRLQ